MNLQTRTHPKYAVYCTSPQIIQRNKIIKEEFNRLKKVYTYERCYIILSVRSWKIGDSECFLSGGSIRRIVNFETKPH